MSLDYFFVLVLKPSSLLTFFVFLLIINIVLLIKLSQLKKRVNALMFGKNAENLEGSINNLISETVLLRKDINSISNEQKKQAEMLASTIKKIGIVRFNPFNNTGGDQSFAIALLDSMNSGILISSLYLREGTRIYAKPIIELKSVYPLSSEEQEAINKAVQ